ncbi:MAG TPA: hypothetical protein C5S51_02430 [Methanosarcinaceae archaeon]|nr:hypothetical protein [Methanosarcinaceae archaeon]
MLENYLADVKASLTASSIVMDIEILDEFITSVSGYLECKLLMIDNSILYISEYFTISENLIKLDKYSYHHQKSNMLLTRWDNAPHHKELPLFPHHVHRKNGVFESKEMSVDDVLKEISETMNSASIL